MDQRDEALINQLIGDNPDLKTLVDNHRDYEKRLEEINKRPYLSTEEDLERKKLQKAKLAGKDKIERILAAHRNN
ncbi:MAG: YdcH family protein [Deltaproteobacteria bacterium]|nr:YdcH family protein [Deltaproteobacteria bacterium]